MHFSTSEISPPTALVQRWMYAFLWHSWMSHHEVWGRHEGFHKWWYPKIDGLYWKILLAWMIWGYPHFRKAPCEECNLFHDQPSGGLWGFTPENELLVMFMVHPLRNIRNIQQIWGCMRMGWTSLEIYDTMWSRFIPIVCQHHHPTIASEQHVLIWGGTTIRIINRETGEETGVFQTDPYAMGLGLDFLVVFHLVLYSPWADLLKFRPTGPLQILVRDLNGLTQCTRGGPWNTLEVLAREWKCW